MRIHRAAWLLAFVASCSPQPTPSGSLNALDLGWHAVGPALGDCGVRAAVVRRSGELVAVCHDGRLNRSTVLTTRSGVDWDIVEPAGIVTRRPGQVALPSGLVETAEGTLVLVGADALDDLSSGDATVWTATDATTWTRGPRSRSVQDGEMLDAVATVDGLIAVGADGFPGANVQLPGLHGPVMWRGGDSARWERIPLPQGPERLIAHGIVAGPAGGFVVWGGGAPPGTGVTWWTADGNEWRRTVDPFEVSDASIGSVAVSPGDVAVAVGCTWPEDGDPLPGAWRSEDGGKTWEATALAVTSPSGCLWDAVWVADRFVATGDGARLVTSRDGRSWADAPVDATMADVRMRSLVALGSSVIGFGSVESDDESTEGIWGYELPR